MNIFFRLLPLGVVSIMILCSCTSNSISKDSTLLRIEGKESAYPRLSNDDKNILYQSNQAGHWQLLIMNIASGRQTPVMQDSFNNNFPDWSPDNNWIAFTSDRDGNEEVYMMHTDGSSLKRLTNDPARDIHPYFSPDGKFIMISSTRGNGSFDVYRYTISSDSIERFTDTPEDETCARYSQDMKQLVFLKNSEKSDDVFLMDAAVDAVRNLTNTPSIMDGWPMFSYDNEWVYYSSHETGTFCIYKIKTDGTMKTLITNATRDEEDARVSVSKDGKSIVYNRQSGNTIEIRILKNI